MAIARRMDKDEDGKVTYDEFQECLIPSLFFLNKLFLIIKNNKKWTLLLKVMLIQDKMIETLKHCSINNKLQNNNFRNFNNKRLKKNNNHLLNKNYYLECNLLISQKQNPKQYQELYQKSNNKIKKVLGVSTRKIQLSKESQLEL